MRVAIRVLEQNLGLSDAHLQVYSRLGLPLGRWGAPHLEFLTTKRARTNAAKTTLEGKAKRRHGTIKTLAETYKAGREAYKSGQHHDGANVDLVVRQILLNIVAKISFDAGERPMTRAQQKITCT